MKKTTIFIRTAIFAIVMFLASTTSGWAASITPTRTDVSGFTSWTDNAVAGTTYLQLITSTSSTITPAMNFDSYTGETLTFTARTYGGGNATQSTITVSISTDNGGSWTVLGTRVPTTNTLIAQTSFDLSSYNGTQVKIRFQSLGASSSKGFGIDDIAITGTAAAVAPVITASQSYSPTVGVAFSQQIAASNSPSSFDLPGGSLPTGLSMSTGGVVSGTPTAAGSFTASITATNGAGTSPAVDVAFTVAKGSQSITFGTLSNKYTSDADYTISATASSGLGVSFSSSNTSVATVTGNTVHIVGVGTTTITASQAGDDNWNAATSVDRTLTVTSPTNPQTITFGALTPVTYGDGTFTLSATASSGLDVTYASSNTTVATVSGSTVTIVGPGTTNITASQAGNGSYNAASDVVQALTVNVKPLTLTGVAVTSKSYDGTNAATITGTLSGIVGLDVVTFSGTGTFADVNVGTGIAVTSTATLGGANAAKYTFTQPTGLTGDITKANQTITFNTAIPAKLTTDAPFTVTATATSGLTVSFTSSNTSVATVSGNTVTIVGAGTATISASQDGNSNYNAAPAGQNQALTVSFPAPVSSAATGLSGTSFNAHWSSVAGCTGYFVDVYARTGVATSDLIISEYLEGSSNNKVIEIYNGTGSSVSLGQYSLKKQTNGAGAYGNELSLTGTLDNNSTYVIALNTASATILALANLSTNSACMSFNGNDAVALFKSGTQIDEVGVFNQTTNWGADVTLIRKSSVTSPKSTYDATEWTSKAIDYTSDLGTHGVILTPISGSTFWVPGSEVTSLYVGGLTLGTYYYTVRATDGSNTSVASNEISATLDITTKVDPISSMLKVIVSNGSLKVEGVTGYSVYNAQGLEVARVSASSVNNSVSLRPGIYIVKTANKSQKVVVR